MLLRQLLQLVAGLCHLGQGALVVVGNPGDVGNVAGDLCTGLLLLQGCAGDTAALLGHLLQRLG
ncbi:hypothetical protein D3C75_1306210 [compost metagenome]